MLATFDSLRRLRPYLGTFVEIAVEGASAAAMEEAVEAAFAAIRTVHMLMSFHDGDSDVSRLNQSAFETAVTVHPWTFQVLETALDLHCRSDGAFDMRIAPYLQKRGLLPYNFGGPPTPDPLASTHCGIELISGQRVRFLERSTQIDLGGIAKGFAVDRAIDALLYHGMPSGVVNAGGDLAAFGPRSVPVTISDPSCRGMVLAQVYLRNGTLASSGPASDPLSASDEGMCAIVDPKTGEPSATMIGATVRAPSCLLADALTKVVMIGGESSLSALRHFDASALGISAEGEVYATPEWDNGAVLAA